VPFALIGLSARRSRNTETIPKWALDLLAIDRRIEADVEAFQGLFNDY
jgi:hypothetical protein